MEPKAHYWFLGRPKGHIRGTKGHSALWKRPSENPGVHVCVCKSRPRHGAKSLTAYHASSTMPEVCVYVKGWPRQTCSQPLIAEPGGLVDGDKRRSRG